jgi:hypothetical protein
MNQLFSHIEFLLHDHNCVIIPDFGGFVINTVSPQRDGIAAFHAPACELVFNRELTYNDGLLAQSYMKCSSMTFEAVMRLIEQDVRSLKRQLIEQRRVDMGRLGAFGMHNDRRFVYTPGPFVRPALFGLTRVALKPLIQMTPPAPARERADRSKRGRSAGMVAVAAAASFLLMLILPAGDSTVIRQSACIVSKAGWLHPQAPQSSVSPVAADETTSGMADETTSDMAGETATEAVEEVAGETAATPEPPVVVTAGEEVAAPVADAVAATDTVDKEITDGQPGYYIVMGVFRKIESARKITQLLHDEGFHQTEWLKRSDCIYIYVATFAGKTEADVYLKEVREKFPAHADAWILKK